MRMVATEFEFRRRSLLNLVHFWIAFQLYSFDHVNIVSAFAPWNGRGAAIVARVVFGVGALLLAIAAAIRTWAAAYLQSDVVHDTALHTERIVADGPYRHVRNPLYIGTLLLTVGLGLLASRSGFFVLVIGGAIRIRRLIGREELQLEKERGERYREFCRLVPRLFPSWHSRIPAAGLVPRWRQAFWGEAFMWGFFVTLVAFTVTLRPSVAQILGLATLAFWLVQRLTWTKSKQTGI